MSSYRVVLRYKITSIVIRVDRRAYLLYFKNDYSTITEGEIICRASSNVLKARGSEGPLTQLPSLTHLSCSPS